VLIEALACGTRIISTDCPSGPKEILENGRWGVLVPVNDIVSLAEQMSNLLEQPKPQTNSRAWDKFTIDYSTKAYETLIREVLE
jgi:glycosyltransferase involved in cell wall biosynthesis